MEVAIRAIGTAIPPHRQSQEKVGDFMASRQGLNTAEKRRLKILYRAAGIKFRHSVLEDFVKEEQHKLDFFPNDPGMPPYWLLEEGKYP